MLSEDDLDRSSDEVQFLKSKGRWEYLKLRHIYNNVGACLECSPASEVMRATMFPLSVRVLFCWWCSLITVGLNLGYGGRILVDARPDQGTYLTQTVYGFLDFTTTIGNTVMIFSPQSAAAVPPSPPKETVSSVNAVINTKPIVSVVKDTVIKPSKTAKSQQNKGTKNSNTPNSKSQINKSIIQSSKVEIQPVIGTKVNVIEGVNSIVNLAPVVTSKVQVVAAPAVQKQAKQSVVTKVEVVADPVTKVQHPIISSHVVVHAEKKPSIVTSSPSIITSVVEVQADEEPAVIVGNNIGEPEYDFLSRQPSEVVEETYKVVNLKPSSKFRLKPRPTAGGGDSKPKSTKRSDHHPTGLVTKLGGTAVKDGVTTVHETSVIGTYISGKYAQVLQSTSQVINNKHGKKPANKINPSGTLRILKTAAPSIAKSNKHGNGRHLEPTSAGSINDEAALPVEALFNSPNSIKGSGNRKQSNNNANSGSNGSFKRFKNRQREQDIEDNEAQQEHDGDRASNNSGKKSSKHRPTQQSSRKQHTTTTPRPQKYGRGSSSKSASLSVHSEQTTTPQPSSGKRYNSRKNKHRTTTTSAPTTQESISGGGGSFSRRGFKPKLQAPTPVDANSGTTSLYKFKLNRSPGRWQYKTTPKPRISIRKQGDGEEGDIQQDSPVVSGSNDVVTPQARSDENEGLVGSESIASIVDDGSETDNKLDNAFPLETIKVEISTPPDFKDIYYEIATIKSPYTFQVGSVKNTRYITVTSTFEKVFDRSDATIAPTATEPLTENILATTSNYAKDNNYLDSSIATLPHLYLASDLETPPLETLTETFSTSQTMLKTHILPVIKGANETSSYTLVQTYLVSRLVTATKTLPPMEAYHFIPSKTLNEFNSHLDEAGSELHLELEFGDENDSDDERRAKKAFPKDLDLASIGSDISDLSDVDKARILESHLRSKKEQQQAVTTSKPIIAEQTPGLSPEQLQQLAFLRLLNPAAAGLNPVGQGQVITTSKPVFRIETLYESLVIPVVNGGNTKLSTISKSLGTVTKTDFEYGTSTIPGLPIPQVNPIFPPQQQAQFAVTSSPIVQNTVITETQSKVLKLTFGAKTAYTTIFSTKVVPTVLTTYMTASVPVAATAAFPGYFPAPYPPFPYVG
ncbi:hypothetical protein Trydic_g8667 [Trypoxylus dichotomus]